MPQREKPGEWGSDTLPARLIERQPMSIATPRTELMALLRAVKADPEDDTPKLALADWLQEQDHPADRARGDYIRVLAACNGLSEDHPARPALLGLLHDLWRFHPDWLGPLTAAGFRCWHNSARWGLLFPGIDGKELVSKKAVALAGSEEYSWVAGLALNRLTSSQNRTFVNSPLVESLIALDYDRCVLEPMQILDLACAPGTAELKYFTVYGGRMGMEGSAAIAGWGTRGLRKLRELSTRSCDIGGDAGFKMLCNSQVLNSLRLLAIAGAGLTLSSATRASYALWSPSRGSSRVRKASQCQPASVSFSRS
jgi:uncharacterized protein (TIGR02996 family)